MSYDEESNALELQETGSKSRDREDRSANVDLSAIYLRDTGATPLLEREDEARLAGNLQTARRKLTRLLLGLPKDCRAVVLEGLDPKGKNWTLADLLGGHDRFRQYVKDRKATSLHDKRRESAKLRREIEESRDAMIMANLRLVTHVVKKSRHRALPFLDLIQEGNIGLIRAVEKFEPERGHKFSTYAYWWIKQAINRAIDDKSRTIRIPVHVSQKLKKIQKSMAELTDELGRVPTVREIADSVQMSVRGVEELLGTSQPAPDNRKHLAE
jgi:RNA polymerase nonessential primary-like sigma factor